MTNKIVIAYYILIKTKKTAHNTIVRSQLSIFKEANKVKSIFEQDYKA